MAGDSTPTTGTMLREARERRGLSLRDIANRTKISAAALEALERNDASRLPGGIFSRAFVRSYAGEVGLDPEQTVRQFMAECPLDSVTVGHPETIRVEDNEAFESSRRSASVFVVVAAVSLPIAAVVFYLGSMGRPAAEPATASRSEARPVALPPPPVSSPETAPVLEAALPPLAEGTPTTPEPADTTETVLKVGLSVRDRCWVSLKIDGTQVLQRELQPGESQAFEATSEVILTAGNAAAVMLTLNGIDAKPLGKPGEVVTRRVTLANLKSYLPAP